MLNLLMLGENIAKPGNQAVWHNTGSLPVKWGELPGMLWP